MGKRFAVILLIGLTFFNLSAFGFWLYRKYATEQPSREPGYPGRMRNMPLWKQLNLSAEQLTRFRQAQRIFRFKADSVGRKLQIARLELLDELLQAQPDRQRIDSLLESISSHQRYLERYLVEHLLAQKTYLTPEQQSTLFKRMMAKIKRPRRRHSMSPHNPKERGR